MTQLEGALNAVQLEYSMIFSTSKVQKHFHGLHKQLLDSMHYLYDDLRIMYPQPMTAVHKAQLEGTDDIVSLRE